MALDKTQITQSGSDGGLASKHLRLNPRLLGLTLGLFSGLALLAATLWLVTKGGEQVGPHLGLLAEYLPGYSVSAAGSLVGFAYGCLIGGATGWLMARVYNRAAGI